MKSVLLKWLRGSSHMTYYSIPGGLVIWIISQDHELKL
uniref:Uncharacterized protein n=1 Tax=Anguilla anguilla TaxID=7936 RepID=A0A0E9RXN5_ANGAN